MLRTIAATVIAAFACCALAAGPVSHIKVLSDNVEDVSSLEAWKQWAIKDGMTDQQKALAVWETVVKFRHQEIPPNEFLEGEGHPHDPIKSFNVYGYNQCCCASAMVEALARYAGLEARGWGIIGHSVPEIRIDGKWCMFDASLVNYFKKPDGSVAGVEEVNKSIVDWNAKNPQYKGDRNKLYKFMAGGGWRKGPEILAGGTGYDDSGWLPAATHAWGDSMLEFGGGKNFLYEYGTAVGYEVNIQLRPGEKLVRNWSNKGLHVNAAEGAGCSTLTETPANASGQLRYSAKFGDRAPGRIGNGTHEYTLPLAAGAYRDGMLFVDNIEDTPAGPRVKDAAKPAEIVLRMPSSYVYLGGALALTPTIGDGGSVAASISLNNGLDWKELARVTQSGPQTINLKDYIYRKYDYRLKFTMSGRGTGLSAVKVAQDIQHSQRPLPLLVQGDNRVRFSAGAQEGTITVQGNVSPDVPKGKNLLFTDFHPKFEGVQASLLRLEGGAGRFTVPIETPGDITCLRIGTHYRVRDPKDTWTFEASFDGGSTFAKLGEVHGPTPGSSAYLVFDKPPASARSAIVRMSGTQRNTTCMLDLRISADYREPTGAFAPVKVSYAWDEDGQSKTNEFVAKSPQDTCTIHCDKKPAMRSITLELAE
ncbi:MAG: hypothetical protein ABSH20_21105 [Tepidisphaeraceae bacterium]|jgi:hypothetical protein